MNTKNFIKERKWTIGVTAFILTVLLSGAGTALAAGPPVGSPAPDFTLQDIHGVTHSLSDYSGKIVVLAFLTPG